MQFVSAQQIPNDAEESIREFVPTNKLGLDS